jgi:AmmeMemoRadiSam system protein A
MTHHTRPDSQSSLTSDLSDIDKQRLLHLARETLEVYLGEGRLPDQSTDSPALLQSRAVFVTLRQRGSGELRGCRGECFARQSLIEAVVNMSIASATDDPRFYPVKPDEVPDLHIEISALTPLKPIEPAEVVVGRHGLMIVKGHHSGLLLPQVPEEQGWSREDFLEGLCRKAGLPQNAWKAHDAQLYGFECEVWGERDADEHGFFSVYAG